MKYFFLLITSFLILACDDDDICMSGEATPRMKVKFKDVNNKTYRIPQLFVDVDFGNGMKEMLRVSEVDSIYIPLRIDNSHFTKIRIRRTKDTLSSSIVQINYALTEKYVSPACGVKRLYQDVSAHLLQDKPILSIKREQNQIDNEEQTHFSFIFDAD